MWFLFQELFTEIMKSGSSLFLLVLSQQPWVGLLLSQFVCISSSLQTYPRELILFFFHFLTKEMFILFSNEDLLARDTDVSLVWK